MGVIEGTKFGYKIHENEVCYRIYCIGGGQIPECLSGQWTNPGLIANAVNAYLRKGEKQLTPEQEHKKKVNEAKKRPSKLKKKED